jgi:hypothetical protein
VARLAAAAWCFCVHLLAGPLECCSSVTSSVAFLGAPWLVVAFPQV